MMDKINFAIEWYDKRSFRERILVLSFGFLIVYMAFNFILFRSVDYEHSELQSELVSLSKQKEEWKTQIKILEQILNNPLYKQWVAQQTHFKNMQHKYKSLINASSPAEWQNIITTVLQSDEDIRIDQIKNLPEIAWKSMEINEAKTKIFEQAMIVSFYGNYLNTFKYVKKLETLLPNVHWDRLVYQTMEYPIGKVDLELSILYEKH